MDHHYVPQFYLRQWTDPDGRLPNYRWLRGRVIPGFIKSTKGTGFEPGLYARQHVPEEEKDKVETEFFQKLDDRASIIHGKLMRMEKFTFTSEERHDWAIFLAAANARTPDVIARLRQIADEALTRDLNDKPEALEKALGKPPPFTLLEWAKKNAPGELANFHLRLLFRHVTDEKLIQTYMDMDWTVHPIAPRQSEVLTCDRPLWYLENPEHLLFTVMLPLSPRRVFIAAKNLMLASDFTALPPRQQVRRINESVFNRADERVYGRANLDYATKLFRQGKRNQELRRATITA